MPGFARMFKRQLFRLIGTPGCPLLIDVQTPEDFAAAPTLVPSARRHRHADGGHADAHPVAPGLLALSSGLARMYASDEAQVKAGLLFHGALFCYSRDETHDAASHRCSV